MADEFAMFGSKPQFAEKLIISCSEPVSNQVVDSENTGNAIMLSSPGASLAPQRVRQEITKLIGENPIREIAVLLHTECFALDAIYQTLREGKNMDPQIYSLFAEPFKANHIILGNRRNFGIKANKELQSLLIGSLMEGWQQEAGGFSGTMRLTLKIYDSLEPLQNSASANLLVAYPSRQHYSYLLDDVSDMIGRKLDIKNTCILQPHILQPPDPNAIKFLLQEKDIKYLIFYAEGHKISEMKKLARGLSENKLIQDGNVRLYVVNKPTKILRH